MEAKRVDCGFDDVVPVDVGGRRRWRCAKCERLLDSEYEGRVKYFCPASYAVLMERAGLAEIGRDYCMRLSNRAPERLLPK